MMKIFLLENHLYLAGTKTSGHQIRCPFCKTILPITHGVLTPVSHDCVSVTTQNKLCRAVKMFRDLPKTVCSACQRATSFESTDHPQFVDGTLSWKHHLYSNNKIVSTAPAPSTCAQCSFASREYSVISKCTCSRICNIQRHTQPIPTGPVLPTKKAPCYHTKLEGCCAACHPVVLPVPHPVETIVQIHDHPEGTRVCFVCQSIGDWPSYYPFPSQHLIQRYHFWKRSPKFICSWCIKKCRFCDKPALGKDEVCTQCFYRR